MVMINIIIYEILTIKVWCWQEKTTPYILKRSKMLLTTAIYIGIVKLYKNKATFSSHLPLVFSNISYQNQEICTEYLSSKTESHQHKMLMYANH